ncbi:MAG: ribokinase [Gammaproteobacteria bacterium]|jgi:ribokinase|uniref:Ribokinase n=1 Tax=Pseudomonas mandelii TaxID=75612 RepID=A0AB36CTC9_9PSED|nr:ribokinase [Pseudomonas mandelii]MBU0526645.1 ribokinase [Gammaproteobacteria bacterium]MBU0817430.1 ribokinase [Gammaproteobacteria bacterium]MBU0845158.1 ribokinase [Gammaproteobacteria bacterium]MBU1839895.1 ribokinase [Gammaproteobacteria bacterium]NMZ79157.1 ribokinase [Pseudomonas mandelii]
MPAKVVVIGSLNMDLVTRAPRLPRGGETLIGQSFATVSGGKGANQAVAAARLGAQVSMVGCVGSDAYGEELRGALMVEQIDCQAVSTVEGSSGVALIVVDDNSQNAIVIVAGANGALTPQVIDRFDAVLQAADVIICQLEVPDATVGHALKRGRELGKIVILNPAPASRPLPADWYASIDYLIPNESEASALSGLPVDSLASAETAATRLIALGAGKVIITLGAQGSMFANGTGFEHFPAPTVKAVDTTAAGDTFVGGFAAALASGKTEAEAIRFGQVAAALSVTRAGAQPSIPTLSEVQAYKTP